MPAVEPCPSVGLYLAARLPEYPRHSPDHGIPRGCEPRKCDRGVRVRRWRGKFIDQLNFFTFKMRYILPENRQLREGRWDMEASDIFSDACLKNGNDLQLAVGQYFRGLAFYKGLCGPVNYKEAAEWFTKAAEQISSFACLGSDSIASKCKNSALYYLGFMYYYGQGVEADYGKAVRWLNSCGSGERYAVLGDAYREGHGVIQNYREAEQCYRKAPEGTAAGAYAQMRLGDMYRDGTGVTQDYSEALKHYQTASEWGSADAQNRLAYMYQNGQGVAKDPAEAMKWYIGAAQNGAAEAWKKSTEMMAGFAEAWKKITGMMGGFADAGIACSKGGKITV